MPSSVLSPSDPFSCHWASKCQTLLQSIKTMKQQKPLCQQVKCHHVRNIWESSPPSPRNITTMATCKRRQSPPHACSPTSEPKHPQPLSSRDTIIGPSAFASIPHRNHHSSNTCASTGLNKNFSNLPLRNDFFCLLTKFFFSFEILCLHVFERPVGS